MAVKRFSHAAAKALRLVGENTRVAARQAYEIMFHELGDPEGNKIARNWSVYSRVLSELWRNGWVGEGARAPRRAVGAAETGLGLDKEDYYTHWLLAYAHKTRARTAGRYDSGWKQDIDRALKHYGHARDRLVAERRKDSSEAIAGDLNAVAFDCAETFVYTGDPQRAAKEMERIIRDPGRAKPQDWEDWAYAFALHQSGRHVEAIGICEGLLEAKNANNDIRLLLAASEARCHMGLQARDTMAAFHRQRQALSLGSDKDPEPVWTVALEIGRGAFPPEPTSDGEKHWVESLQRARLDETGGGGGKPQADFLRPSDPKVQGGGGAAAAPQRKAAKKRPARKKLAKRKTAKRPAKKAVKRKLGKRQRPRSSAKRRGARKSAKRKS